MPIFGPVKASLQSHLIRAAKDFIRVLNGLSPLAPEGALTLCEDDERGRLAVAQPGLTDGGKVSTLEP